MAQSYAPAFHRIRHNRGVRIELVRGDITEQDVDAVVNAANRSLLGGGGVDGAIHRRGGPEILEACRRLRAERYPDGLPTGQAVATTAGRLSARWVIHTVGPVFARSEDRSALLASCHTESLRVADELGARTVAFPAISTGVYGYPLDQAAPIAIRAVRESRTAVEEVRFVLFDEPAHSAFDHALHIR
jgi:O-acetyl-ADP-ribose deacetylase